MRILAATVLLAAACQAQERNIKRENIEWTDVWFPTSNDHDLPRVALIGDSITRAYFAAVESNLKGKAYCARIATSKAVGDPALPVQLATFLLVCPAASLAHQRFPPLVSFRAVERFRFRAEAVSD